MSGVWLIVVALQCYWGRDELLRDRAEPCSAVDSSLLVML
jgi:hypothetical protein